MARLILSMDRQILGEFPLNKARTTIGRRTGNDIHIDNLAISGEHAVVLVGPDGVFLEDLGSTNGTKVNGQSAQKVCLKDGDLVELGKFTLAFRADPAEFEKTVVLDPGSSPPRPAVPPRQMATPLPQGEIRVLDGVHAGRLLDLNKTLMTIGRKGVQVAMISRRPQGFFITHVEGARFPALNGRMLDAQAHALADRDVIDIAGIRLEFLRKD